MNYFDDYYSQQSEPEQEQNNYIPQEPVSPPPPKREKPPRAICGNSTKAPEPSTATGRCCKKWTETGSPGAGLYAAAQRSAMTLPCQFTRL